MAYPHVDSITAKPKMLTYWGKGENFSRKFKEGLIGNILKKTEKKKKKAKLGWNQGYLVG